MATADKRRSQQREKVLLAARKCFVRHGFHATGMAEIAKACRMSAGNIYHYFPHKNAIVLAIAEGVRSRLLPALRSSADHHDPVEGLVEIMLLSLREIGTGSNARLWMEISAEASRNQVIRKACLAFDRDLRDLLVGLVQAAVQRGKLPDDTDLEATSLWLMASLDGAIARLAIEPDIEFIRFQDTLARSLRRFFRPARA